MGIAAELEKLSSERGTAEQAGFGARTAMLDMHRQIMDELAQAIPMLIRQEVDALKVRDGIDGKSGVDGENGADGSPDAPTQIKDKLETLKEEERLDASAIKNLPRLIETMSRGKKGGGGGGSTLRVDNLSSQANSSTRTFTTTYRIGSSHLLFYSSFPTLFLPTTDYSVSNRTVTLDSNINPPQSGQSLAIIYEDAS